MSSPEPAYRSYLFAPGSSERLVASALATNADAVVVDLEDAVLTEDREVAHEVVRAANGLAERVTHLRVGQVAGRYRDDDLRLAVEVHARAVRLPKASDPDEVARVGAVLAAAEALEGVPERITRLYPTIEDAAGLSTVEAMAAASDRVSRFVFGERDFMADLGVDVVGPLTDHARATLALSSRAAGVGAPADGAFIHLDDDEGLRESARRARDLGFSGKSALHPRQLEVIHAVFAATADQLEWAGRVVDAYDGAVDGGAASVVVDGVYVDAAVVRRARSILEHVDRGDEA